MENPWGRSISAEAQVELAANFHVILQAPLPSFPTSDDHITVWRRTQRVPAGQLEFNSIPKGEKVDVLIASNKLKYLLKK